jgi:hypothetical protein
MPATKDAMRYWPTIASCVGAALVGGGKGWEWRRNSTETAGCRPVKCPEN